MPLQFGGQYPETGYKVLGGADLNTLFCKKYSSTEANTSLLLSDGQDLSDVFEKRHAVGYSSFISTNQGIRVVYPLTSTSIYCGGDNGTLFKWDGSTTTTSITTNTAGQSIREIYAISDTNIYIGGLFPTFNNSNSMAYIAKYNGSVFAQVGSTALNGYVNAMSALDPSNVYIGGNFTNANIGARISRLNTYSNLFTPLTSEMSDVSLNNVVSAISALDISNVYIGGGFTNAGNIGSYITRWDGEKFNKLGDAVLNGAVGTIHALDPSHVYFTGSFTQYGNNTAYSRIAMWDGTNMTALGNGLTVENDVRTVYALDEDHVYIGGAFTYIKMWNGRNYITLAGSGSFNLSNTLSLNMLPTDKSTLYFGGGGGGVQKWTT
jgi:hypothetical protein